MVGVKEADEGSLEIATLETPFVLLATIFAVLRNVGVVTWVVFGCGLPGQMSVRAAPRMWCTGLEAVRIDGLDYDLLT